MNELDQYILHIDHLVQQLSPAQSLNLMRKIGSKIRQSNKQRIRANTEPDGNAFTPSKAHANGRKTRRIGVEQTFLYKGKLHRYRTIHDYGDYYIGYDYHTHATFQAHKNKIYLPTGDGRRRQMFRKIHQYKFLKLKAQSHEAAIGFLSGLTGYIAAAHQYGTETRPERTLLGFSEGDLQLIQHILQEHLNPNR